ncbi:MAG: nitroreductase family protein, partial [Pseudomonadota bacterium]|nr:nitroreductase family protein [Pseudomonadota bacterium]
MLDNARFAPSGGNRQGNRVIVVRDQNTKNWRSALNIDNPWNYTPAVCTPMEIEATKPASLLTEPVKNCSVALVFIVELKVAASMDQDLDCVGIISGGSIYPFVWSILMGARQAGFGGTITKLACAEEDKVKELLNIPENFAVCAVVPL